MNQMDFRETVKMIHPDVNPGITKAGEKMRTLITYKKNPRKIYMWMNKWGLVGVANNREQEKQWEWVKVSTLTKDTFYGGLASVRLKCMTPCSKSKGRREWSINMIKVENQLNSILDYREWSINMIKVENQLNSILDYIDSTNNEKIVCLSCGKRHFPDEKTFFTFYGNVTIGLNGGLIGNQFNDDGTLARVSFLCNKKRCLSGLLDYCD